MRAASYAEGRCAMRTALFLGAGASVPYGMPTTKELWDRIRDDNSDFPRADIFQSDQFPDIEHVLLVLDQLFDFLQSREGKLFAGYMKSRPDNEEYNPDEVLFAAKKFNTYVENSRRSKDAIERFITRHYKWDPPNNETAELILGPLFAFVRSEDGHVTIFTTNYDTAIEEYCRISGHKTECVDGFKFDDVKRMVTWDGKFVPRNDDLTRKVFLHKLHGSMNWLADDSGNRGSIVQKPDTSASDDRARDMYIRPSLDTKDVATRKEPYATILSQFCSTLPSFDMCIVVGYSFRDPHISKELVKFAKSGKLLVLLSPTAASDFENNALIEEPPTDGQSRWIDDDDDIQLMYLGSGSSTGTVYAMNKSLNIDTAPPIIDYLKVIVGGVSSRKTATGS